jgi:hypothetical protein
VDKKWVYIFSQVDEAEKYAGDWEGVRALLGGKGSNLAEMTRIGMPVPPGFTVTTEACNAYLAGGNQFPKICGSRMMEALKEPWSSRPARSLVIPQITLCWFPAVLAPSSRCPA